MNSTGVEMTSNNSMLNTSMTVISETSSGLDFYLTVYVSSMGIIIAMMIAKGFLGARVSAIHIKHNFVTLVTSIDELRFLELDENK